MIQYMQPEINSSIDSAKHPPTGAEIGWPPWSCLNHLILYIIDGKTKDSMRKSGFQKIQLHGKPKHIKEKSQQLISH